jgi:hypothetical protein
MLEEKVSGTIAERIKEAGAGLRSLAEPWADTTTLARRMVLTVFTGIADFERSLIVGWISPAGLRLRRVGCASVPAHYGSLPIVTVFRHQSGRCRH